MKFPLILILIGTFFNTYGQNMDALQQQLQVMLDSVVFQLDTSGLSQLPPVKEYTCGNEVPYYNAHVCDLNQDGLNDLVFTGGCMPYSETVVLLNLGNTFQKVYASGGRVLSIEKKGDITTMLVLAEACCCDEFSSLLIAQFGKDNTCERRTISFHYETEISFDAPLKQTIMSGIVRTSPKVNDKRQKSPCNDEIEFGNRLLKIKNRELVVLGQKGAWALVCVAKDSEEFYIGWIKITQ